MKHLSDLLQRIRALGAEHGVWRWMGWCLGAAGVFAAFHNPLTYSVHLLSQDLLFKSLQIFPREKSPEDPVVIIGVDDLARQAIHEKWPWPRELFARMIDRVSKAGSSAIVLDFLLLGPSKHGPTDDRLLAQSLRRAGHVFLATYINPSGQDVDPEPVLTGSAKGKGFINTPVDPDGTLRVFTPWRPVADSSGVMISLPLAVARHLKPGLEDPALIPSPQIIPFRKRAAAYPYFSAADILTGNYDASDFQGKVVLIGGTAALFADSFRSTIGEMNGVFVLANQLESLLEGVPYRVLSPAVAHAFYLVALFGLFAFISGNASFKKNFSASAATLAVWPAVVLTLFYHRLIIPEYLLLPLGTHALILGASAYRFRLLSRERARIRELAVRDELTGLPSARYCLYELQAKEVKPFWKHQCLALFLMALEPPYREGEKLQINLPAVGERLAAMSSRHVFPAHLIANIFFVAIFARDKAEALAQFEKAVDELKRLFDPPITVSSGYAARSMHEDLPVQKLYARASRVFEGLAGGPTDQIREYRTGTAPAEDGTAGVEVPKTELAFLVHELETRNRELRDALAQIEKTQQEMLRSEKIAAAGESLARFTHEIKTPLSNLATGLAALRGMLGQEPKAGDLVDILAKEVKRVHGLSAQMLSFFKPPEEERKPVKLCALLDGVLSLCEQKFAKSAITLSRAYETPELTIWAAASQIQQVMLNILMNAADAMVQGGRVHMRVATKENGGGVKVVQVEISDTGKGIAPEQLNRVFDSFFTTKPKGTGLGLSIAYAIVKKHGGKIEVQSTPGKGSRFTVSLPVLTGSRW